MLDTLHEIGVAHKRDPLAACPPETATRSNGRSGHYRSLRLEGQMFYLTIVRGYFMRFTLANCLLFLLTLNTPAQQSTARLLGTVTDQTGAVVVGASVKSKNTATGQERSVASDQTGEYSVPLLPI